MDHPAPLRAPARSLARERRQRTTELRGHDLRWLEQRRQGEHLRLVDVFGASSIESIGVAEPAENQLPFIFKNEKGEISFRNSFVYDPAADAWEWRMFNVDKGVDKPFGLVKLTRK